MIGEKHMAGKLRPLDIERETKPGKYADGDGLYLIVAGPAAKSWSYRYWKDGTSKAARLASQGLGSSRGDMGGWTAVIADDERG